jgi:hypothetical protein
MSSASIVSGTPPTNLVRRLLLFLRIAPVARLFRDDPIPVTAPRGGPLPPAARVVSPIVAPDPLDDLENATWEDAAWQ